MDARFVDRKNKKVWAVEKFPSVDGASGKEVRGESSAGTLRFELQKQYPG